MAIRDDYVSGLFYSSSVESPGIVAVRKSIGYLASAFMVLLLLNLPLRAQDWSWPDKPENLRVLSEEFAGRRLGGVMRGFIIGLGVRCGHCHVGVDGKPLSTFDFASDENPNKNRAREMMRMVEDIKGHLQKIEPSGVSRVQLTCLTCHGGRTRPITLSAQLKDTHETDGLEASLAQYSELKEKYYGKGAYHFKESILNALGYAALKKDDKKGALNAFKLNSVEYPESFGVWDSLAEGYMLNGDNKKAKKYYKKSLKLNPKNKNATKMLKKL